MNHSKLKSYFFLIYIEKTKGKYFLRHFYADFMPGRFFLFLSVSPRFMAKKKSAPPLSASERFEDVLSRNLGRLFWISLVLTSLFALLLFDIRFSIAGDDSAYVERSYDFIHQFIFPGFRGPFYPIVLSPFVLIFGISAIPLKILSLLFILGFLWLFYRAYRNRIPAILVASVLLLLPVCSAIMYFASQTYSESLFMFLQALTLLVFFSFFCSEEEQATFRTLSRQHLMLALCVLAMALTRPIGYAAAIAVSVYFLAKTRWKDLLIFIAAFVLILVLFNGLKSVVFGISGSGMTGEVTSLLSKDYYHPELGREDIRGIITRLALNTNWYISSGLYSILGLRDLNKGDSPSTVLTAITLLILITATFFAVRKNRYLLFTGIYVLTTLLATFFVADAGWKQARLIVPIAPLVLLMILSFFYYSLSHPKISAFRTLLPVIVAVAFILMLKVSFAEVKTVRKVEDKYSGLNPDLVNYCKASEWASSNLPPGSLVACRKPSISFIYSKGMKFFGITRMIAYPEEKLFSEWKGRHLRYLVVSSSEFRDHIVSRELYFAFRNWITAFGMSTKNSSYTQRFLVLDLPDTVRRKVLQEMTAAGISYITDPNQLKSSLNSAGEPISVIYPDSLLNFFEEAKVTHVMTDNFRVSPDRKNEQMVTLVDWYLSLIEFKYAEIRTKVVQVGTENEEPATIYRLNYEARKIKLK